jgi:hypothetical protein
MIIFIGFPPVIFDQSHENARQETCHANLPFIVSPQGITQCFGKLLVSVARSLRKNGFENWHFWKRPALPLGTCK